MLVRALLNYIHWIYLSFSHENPVKKYFSTENQYYNFLQLSKLLLF